MALIFQERNICRLVLTIMKQKLALKPEAVLPARSLRYKGTVNEVKVIVTFITGVEFIYIKV